MPIKRCIQGQSGPFGTDLHWGVAIWSSCPAMNSCSRSVPPRIPVLEEDLEYAIFVNEKGCAVVGRDISGLMRGYFDLLMKLKPHEGKYILCHTCRQSNYLLKNRMIHICVFPENDLYFIKKLIRLAALCQYTHIVIEFWGMLRYDRLKELAWPHAFTKAEAGELIRECRELGMEPVPMFNHLGHATGSRLCYGKHVVLDQNAELEHLFTPDGWAWNIGSSEVAELLRGIRNELFEVFGTGEYCHIGCDEAYYISRCPQMRQVLRCIYFLLVGVQRTSGGDGHTSAPGKLRRKLLR